MITELTQSLNGGYNGLYGEVVTGDVYRIKSLPFTPDIIFDLGGNVGVFTRFAAEVFPQAQIISVEPDKDNCSVFKQFTNNPNVTLLEAAIGKGKIWRCDGAINGAHESYLPATLGLPFKEGVKINGISETNVEAIMPSEFTKMVKNKTFIVKIDIEGAENVIWDDYDSMEFLSMADYICMEMHLIALNGQLSNEVREKTFAAFASFLPTHRCQIYHPMFYAIKNKYQWKYSTEAS